MHTDWKGVVEIKTKLVGNNATSLNSASSHI